MSPPAHNIHLRSDGGGNDQYNTQYNVKGRIDDREQRIMQHHNLRRKAMYLPPSPITPFRGRLISDPDDSDDNTNNIESSSEDSLEASSSDSDWHRLPTSHRDPGVAFSHSSIPPSKISVSPWAPEDYPDPWTNPKLCGGAATASLMNEQYEYQKLFSLTDPWESPPQQSDTPKMWRPLFCDPDQVLDMETLRNIAVKLKDFAQDFASSGVTEGVDFGTTSADDQLDENLEASDQNQDEQPSQDSLSSDGVGQSRSLSSHRSGAPLDSHPVRNLRNTMFAEKRLYSDSVGGIFSTRQDKVAQKKDSVDAHRVEVAIALVQKINLPAILRSDSYFFYSDQDDMVNDAAQYFARYIHDTWSKHLAQEQKAGNTDVSSPTSIVLIFISTQDRICYISSGTHIAAILPWWRLEHVVEDMKHDLRKGQTGDALSIAINDLTDLLRQGPPTFGDRVHDFFQRFGIVMLFTIFTFVFATWGECRDRRKRLFFVERRSRMTAAEKEKARLLQKEFRTKMCPICLEPFDLTPDKDPGTETISLAKENLSINQKQKVIRVDDYGIPLIGSDDQPIKMLRCGHIFDKTCFQMWTDSGQGNPYICPVCRQDVGRTKKASTARRNNAGEGGNGDDAREREEASPQEDSSLFSRIVANTPGPSMLLRPVTNTHPNYNSTQPRPFAPLSHPTLRRLHPIFGLSTEPPIEGL
ncbi:hypothetical protein ACHAXR_004280, partial [Thalassiosira sp. AJA248-18]